MGELSMHGTFTRASNEPVFKGWTEEYAHELLKAPFDIVMTALDAPMIFVLGGIKIVIKEGAERLAERQLLKAGAETAEHIGAGAAERMAVEGAERTALEAGEQGALQATKASRAGAMAGRRLGHTFTKHGAENTAHLLKEAAGSGKPVGQWLDNAAAERFIAEHLDQLKNGARTFDLPEGLGRVVNPNGTFSAATQARLVPSGSGVKTAFPFIE